MKNSRSFSKDGPTKDELERAKTQFEAGFIRGIERIGGFGGKSDILAHNFVFTGQPDYYKTTLEETRTATAKEILQTAPRMAERWRLRFGSSSVPEIHRGEQGRGSQERPLP